MGHGSERGTGVKETNRSASSITSISRPLVSPTPTPFSFRAPPFPFFPIATLLLPSKNSSSLPGVPIKMSAPVSKNACLSDWSEFPPISKSGGAMVRSGSVATEVEVEGSEGSAAESAVG